VHPGVLVGGDHVPGLGLAVAAAEVASCPGSVGVQVDGEALAGVEQFDEQARVGSEVRDVLGPEPGPRLLGDRIAEQPPVGQDGEASLRGPEPRRRRRQPLFRGRARSERALRAGR
jgi:hypothetical protein